MSRSEDDGNPHMGQFPQDGKCGHLCELKEEENTNCPKTKRDSLVFSTVPDILGLVHHKNVTNNSCPVHYTPLHYTTP